MSRERASRPYTLHSTQSFIKYCWWFQSTQSSSVSLHDQDLRVFFVPCLFFFLSFIRRLFVCAGSALAANIAGSSSILNSTSMPSPSSPHVCSALIAVRYLFPCRLLCSLSAQLLILLISHRIREPQSTCILPGVVLYQVPGMCYGFVCHPAMSSVNPISVVHQ